MPRHASNSHSANTSWICCSSVKGVASPAGRVHGIQGRLQLFQEILRVLRKRSRARLHDEFRNALRIEAFLFQFAPYLQ